MWDINAEVSQPYKITLYTREINNNLTLYHQRVTTAALSPNNRILALGDSEHNIGLYEVISGKLIVRMEGHTAPLYRLRFSPDGTRLLSADDDGQVILWNTSSGAMVESLAAHTGSIRGMVWGLDGNLRAWANNTAWTLNPQDGGLLHTTSVYSGTIFAASPAGDWLAVSNRLRMSIWDANTGKLIQVLAEQLDYLFVEHYWEGLIRPEFFRAFFSADGKKLFTEVPGQTWTYELQAGLTFSVTETSWWPYYKFLYGKSGPHAASPDEHWQMGMPDQWGGPPELVLSNDAGMEIRRLALAEDEQVTALAFSPDARLVAIGQADGSIALLDVVEWKRLVTFPAHQGAVTALVFSLDGFNLASAGDDGSVRFWRSPK